MKQRIAARTAGVLFSVLSLVSALGESPSDGDWWPQFLGPNGRATAGEQSIPLMFAPGENRLWSVPTPEGNSSPIIWADRIFITGHEGADLMVLCYDRNDGRQLWRQSYPSSFEEDYFHVDCTPAASTSCTDGKRLVSCLGTYGLVAHTLDGEELWQRAFQDMSMPFGTGSSPILWKHRVYVLRDTPKGSSLLCLDADTGEERWVAKRDAKSPSFSTPCLWHHGDSSEVVVAGSGSLDAYDAMTGEPAWTVTGMPKFVCPTPVVQEDVLVFGAWATVHVGGTERTKSAFADGELTEAELTDANSLVKRFDKNDDGALSREELPESRARNYRRAVFAMPSGFTTRIVVERGN
jgi:outer membrane protein assembly factor BamB